MDNCLSFYLDKDLNNLSSSCKLIVSPKKSWYIIEGKRKCLKWLTHNKKKAHVYKNKKYAHLYLIRLISFPRQLTKIKKIIYRIMGIISVCCIHKVLKIKHLKFCKNFFITIEFIGYILFSVNNIYYRMKILSNLLEHISSIAYNYFIIKRLQYEKTIYYNTTGTSCATVYTKNTARIR